ncbi:50S ribosomal protein L21 [Buchnera aphidicola]|nr:50S ribosomal protein L21 [Buchnera aphidicola]
MYAVFFNGGKQYKVIPNQIIRIEKLNIPQGNEIKFNQVLMISNEKDTKIGNPFLLGSVITASVEKHGRAKKIKIIKFHRRKHYKKKQGHRQYFTDIKILNINYNTLGQ